MTARVLYVFAISHYCEKARWGLDDLAIPYRLEHLAPGAHVILEHPDTVRPIFERDLEGEQREALAALWPLVPAAMAERMGLGREQQQDSRRIVAKEFDWLDAQLADGRRFLLGDRFSRVDLTAASLVAPLAAPPEHLTYAALSVPPRVRADLDAWVSRPTARWVGEMYREYR